MVTGTGVKGVVALTYDDGPNAITSPKLLDALRKYNVPASFFLVGKNIVKENNKQLVERMLAEGHFIASHTLEHPNLAKISESDVHRQVEETENVFFNHTGMRPFFIRAPFGALNEKVKTYLRTRNYTVVGWSLDTTDWKQSDKVKFQEVARQKLQLKAGIMLMHEYVWSTEGAEDLIKYILGKGLRIVPLSWFLTADGKAKLFESYNCSAEHPALYDRMCIQLSPTYDWESEWVPNANLTALAELAAKEDKEMIASKVLASREEQARALPPNLLPAPDYLEEKVFDREMERLRNEQVQQNKAIQEEFERVREELAELGAQAAENQLLLGDGLEDVKEALVLQDQSANVRAMEEKLEKLARVVMVMIGVMVAYAISRCWCMLGRNVLWGKPNPMMENHLHHV